MFATLSTSSSIPIAQSPNKFCGLSSCIRSHQRKKTKVDLAAEMTRHSLYLSMWIFACMGHVLTEEASRCEQVTVPMCRNIGWNITMMPNVFNHETQDEAGLEAHQFWPLVKTNCSADLTVFLCSLYTPVCINGYDQRLPPCRSLCLRAKAGCAPMMATYGFPWPERMACEDLPVFGDENNLCMDPKNGTYEHPPPPTIPEEEPYQPTTPLSKRKPSGHLPPTPATPSSRCSHSCPNPVLAKYPLQYHYGGVEGCAAACRNPMAGPQEMLMAEYWIIGWAIICCLCTAFTLTTYIIDTSRFKYPERPIIFIALCYLMVSVGFLIRVIAGHDNVACDGPAAHQFTVGSSLCTIVFLLLYFFGMASCVWWVILSLSWYLTAGRRWSAEAISEHSTKYHFFAWVLPFIQSSVALWTRAVDGDSLAGVCYIGNHNTSNLMGFVVVPLCIYLGLGVFLLLIGFVSMKKIHKNIRMEPASTKAHRMKRLMKRIGVYSLLTFLPNAAVVACHLYEFYTREEWERWQTSTCRDSRQETDTYFAVVVVKYLCLLLVGIVSAVWLIGHKTVESWRYLLCGKCHVESSSSKSSEFTIIHAPESVMRYQRPSYPSSHV
ncbi:hypothetical protein RvY_05561 [Ramazzottius varieornatus]|uniref:Frizzled-4 n=1 Tax=Ramazzottius varieornatus TaxID=947166 RepID=A0A1D1UVH7_RAMVA|nr:hypothetical protein RvY_05561 [Ramazzottius varieornatus]